MGAEEPSDPDLPGVIAPAPLIFVPGLLLGLGLDYLWPVVILPAAIRYPGGIFLIGLSLLPVVWALVHFRRAKTSFDPRKPSSELITVGPFAYSRNPIYLAMGLLLAGIGVLASSMWIFPFLVVALVITQYGIIRREESYLERRFGKDYLAYKSKVRRWF